MRFKYYLKGLGMGIIITTIIMTVSCVIHNNNLSDQEIIEKAMELGMVMQTVKKNPKMDCLAVMIKNPRNLKKIQNRRESPKAGVRVK